MIGLGTVVNSISVIVGSIIGLLIKKGLSARFEDILMKALGLSTIFIGVTGALSGLMSVKNSSLDTEVESTLLMIFSLSIGALIGELARIEERLDKMGESLKKKIKFGTADSRFVEGFVTNTLVICVGAMAIVGSLNDGLKSDASLLYTKSALDFVSAIVFSSALGIGALFAVIPMIIYQGGITLAARFVAPYLTDALVSDLGYIGSVLIFAIGINLAFGKKFKTGNMLPAILIPVVYHLVIKNIF